MMSEEKKWQHDGRTIFLLNDMGVNRFDMTIQPGWQDGDRGRTKYFECEEMAAKLTQIINAHEALVGACENIEALASGWDEEGALGPREPLSWETVARMSMDYARAALAAAKVS